ncbi:hypothetical protein K2173_028302 [Erythroxylum novogranatense]|uniref:V-type proton ATPase subunit C n=1 Tax=Erythroxylum novogranatense TaxID=1862640 RepID=A0AAV8U1L7_9ROSI|nr:hypothetical protein K2173_028302 [Erythroxylum novogranatense]
MGLSIQDSLLALNDDLVKSNNFIEGVSYKIRSVETNSLTVDGVPVDSYLTRFLFLIDEAKYPTMSPLREIVDDIHTQGHISPRINLLIEMSYTPNRYMALCSRHMLLTPYNNVQSQLNAINQKQSGSLAIRDLSNMVKLEDIISSEHLKTLLAIFPKYSQKEWLATYETLTCYVVPKSSKKFHEDNEYALYTVTLFLCVADNFRTGACKKGLQIRDFEYSPEAQETRKQELERLMQDQDGFRSSLLQWCYTSYGEMHFCAVCVYAESILRYGLPPSFLACILFPSVKSVCLILEGVCETTNSLGESDRHIVRLQYTSYKCMDRKVARLQIDQVDE